MLSLYAREIGEEGIDYDEPLSAEDLAVINQNDSVFKPVSGRLKLRIELIDHDVRVGGFISAHIETTCVSCLDTFYIDQEVPVELFLSPGVDEELPDPAKDETLVIEDEECGIDHYNPDEPLELGSMAVELLSVALPMHPRCKDDCKGLCQDCGANLNYEQCNCRHVSDPRWNALAAIKLDK